MFLVSKKVLFFAHGLFVFEVSLKKKKMLESRTEHHGVDEKQIIFYVKWLILFILPFPNERMAIRLVNHNFKLWKKPQP